VTRTHHKDQLLAVLFHYMDQPLRGKVMREAPVAYNAYCGREIVRVVRTSDTEAVAA